MRVVPVGRPRDAPFASIASAADVASLEAMRAELDSTSSALEEALDARERLRARRLQTARVGAGVAALQQRLDALDAVAAEAGEEDARGRDATESGGADVDTYEERGERAVVPETFSSLPRVEGLSESIARALEPVRVFCESSLRDDNEGETKGRSGTNSSAPAGVGVPELARAFERRRETTANESD